IAVGLFVVTRGALTLIVSGVFDRPVAHFPIYLGSALAVEAVGLLMATSVTRAPIKFAVAAGAAIGTVGLAWEWAWSHVWMVFPWPEALWPEGAIAGFVAAISGACIGVWIGNSLMMRPRIAGAARFAPVLGAVAIMALVGYGLNEQRPAGGITAQVTTETVETGKPGRWITATAKLDSRYFDDGTKWAQALAWQGPGFENVDLVRVAPGTYEMAEPIPADGKWKTVMRFHAANTIMALPIYEPRDDAIPAAETPALPSFTRKLQPDREVLQRESKIEGGTLPLVGYLLMLTIALTLLALLAWGIWRVGLPDEPGAGTTAGPGASPGRSRQAGRASKGSGGAPEPRAA
ncbi:MAG: hypothetical protein HZB14_10405, partial [Actinobacteria bacterium]|nr:hypothetical protein [Actinomycetota bacterium]